MLTTSIKQQNGTSGKTELGIIQFSVSLGEKLEMTEWAKVRYQQPRFLTYFANFRFTHNIEIREEDSEKVEMHEKKERNSS